MRGRHKAAHWLLEVTWLNCAIRLTGQMRSHRNVAQVAANEKQRPSDALSQDVNNTRRQLQAPTGKRPGTVYQVHGRFDQQASGPSSSSPPFHLVRMAAGGRLLIGP